MRASVFALGAQLGLDEAETRLQISRRSGRSFEDTGARELASVLRSMADALSNAYHAGKISLLASLRTAWTKDGSDGDSNPPPA